MPDEPKSTGIGQSASGTNRTPPESRPETEVPITGKTVSVEDRLTQTSTDLKHTQDDVARHEKDNKENKLIMLSVLFIVAIMVATIIVMVLLSWSDSNARVLESNSALQVQIYNLELNQEKSTVKPLPISR